MSGSPLCYCIINTIMSSEQSPEPPADGVPVAESEEELDLRSSMLMTQGEATRTFFSVPNKIIITNRVFFASNSRLES